MAPGHGGQKNWVVTILYTNRWITLSGEIRRRQRTPNNGMHLSYEVSNHLCCLCSPEVPSEFYIQDFVQLNVQFEYTTTLNSQKTEILYQQINKIKNFEPALHYQHQEDEIFEISSRFEESKGWSQDDCLNFKSKPKLFNTSKSPIRAIYNFQTGLALTLEIASCDMFKKASIL